MIQRMDHVGIVVDDLAAATESSSNSDSSLQGEGPVEGRWVDRPVGLEGVRARIAMVQTPDGTTTRADEVPLVEHGSRAARQLQDAFTPLAHQRDQRGAGHVVVSTG